jgi:hypothetical protein
MNRRTESPGVLPRVLYWATLTAAVVLFLMVLLGPTLHSSSIGGRFVAVFAQDPTLRRTALASAVGLVVTARVFFRPVAGKGVRKPPQTAPPPIKIVGA